MVAHDAVEVGFVGGEFEVGEEAEGAEGEGEDGRDDALEKPGGEEDGTVAAEGQDEIEHFGRTPAEIGCPVFEHAFVARVFGNERGRIEAFGFTQLGINIDGHAQIRIVAWCFEKPFGELAGQVDETVVSCFGYNHDGLDGPPDRPPLQLLGYFSNTSRCLHEPGMGEAVIFGCDLFQHALRIDSIIEPLVEEARILQAC